MVETKSELTERTLDEIATVKPPVKKGPTKKQAALATLSAQVKKIDLSKKYTSYDIAELLGLKSRKDANDWFKKVEKHGKLWVNRERINKYSFSYTFSKPGFFAT